jgi:hypothetical protein
VDWDVQAAREKTQKAAQSDFYFLCAFFPFKLEGRGLKVTGSGVALQITIYNINNKNDKSQI